MTDVGFERAVREHKDRVHTYAVWMLGEREEARDVSQEALVRLWQHRERVHEPAARTWLMRTTHHLCIDRLRRRSARPEVAVENLAFALPDGKPSPERSSTSEQLGRAIKGALASLSPRDRSIVLMREVQGMAYEQIATVLDMPLGTLKATLHRCREKLREELSEAGIIP